MRVVFVPQDKIEAGWLLIVAVMCSGEQFYENDSYYETPDVRPPCYAATLGICNGRRTIKKLYEKPESQYNIRRQFNKLPDKQERKQNQYTRPRIAYHVSA